MPKDESEGQETSGLSGEDKGSFPVVPYGGVVNGETKNERIGKTVHRVPHIPICVRCHIQSVDRDRHDRDRGISAGRVWGGRCVCVSLCGPVFPAVPVRDRQKCVQGKRTRNNVDERFFDRAFNDLERVGHLGDVVDTVTDQA